MPIEQKVHVHWKMPIWKKMKQNLACIKDSLFFQFSNLFKSSQWMTEWRLNDWLDEWMIERTNSDLRDWVYTLETETLFSLVSITRLRPRLKILESRDRDFDETFFWLFETETELFIFSRPRLRLDESQNRDFSRPRLFHYDF